jgi:hypothetical protein
MRARGRARSGQALCKLLPRLPGRVPAVRQVSPCISRSRRAGDGDIC